MNGARLGQQAEQERLRHTLALRFIDDLPEDAYLARDPNGPRFDGDPAASLGVRVVQVA
jgi:hypothetical protein